MHTLSFSSQSTRTKKAIFSPCGEHASDYRSLPMWLQASMKQLCNPSPMSIACSTSSTSPAHPISTMTSATTSEPNLQPNQESPSSTIRSDSRFKTSEIINYLWISGKLLQLPSVQLDNSTSLHYRPTIIPYSQLNITLKKTFINGMSQLAEPLKAPNSRRSFPTNSWRSQEKTQTGSLLTNNSKNR